MKRSRFVPEMTFTRSIHLKQVDTVQNVLIDPNIYMTKIRAIQRKWETEQIQSTPDNWNLQGKLKKVRVIGTSNYQG